MRDTQRAHGFAMGPEPLWEIIGEIVWIQYVPQMDQSLESAAGGLSSGPTHGYPIVRKLLCSTRAWGLELCPEAPVPMALWPAPLPC